MRPRRWAPVALVLALLAIPASLAGADSFTPIRMNVTITPVARLRVPLKVRVGISADKGVLDGEVGKVQIDVKLAAGECGGSFQTTPGTTLLSAKLKPQPATGKNYSAAARGSGKPTTYGVRTLCVYLEDTGVGRVYANDESLQVNVSKPCTSAGRTYDAANRALKRSERTLAKTKGKAARRRVQRTLAARKRTLARDRGRGRKACGSGVAL